MGHDLHLLLADTGRPFPITWPHRHYNTQDGSSQLPPKRCCIPTRLHVVTTQKTPVWTTCDALHHCHLQTVMQKEIRSLSGRHSGTSLRLSAVGAGLPILRLTVSDKPCPSSREQMHVMGWQLKNCHYSRPLTKPHHLLLSLVGYITLSLPHDVPRRNKPENEIAVAHPAIPERRWRSRPRKVQLT